MYEESIQSGCRQARLNCCCIFLLNMSCKIHRNIQESFPPSEKYAHLRPEQEGPGARPPTVDGLSHSLKETQTLVEHPIWRDYSYTNLAHERRMRGPSLFASIYANLQGSGSVACWLRRRWSLQCSFLQFQLRALPVSAIEQSPCQ